jgi:flavin reductase (DIM6/NTAB) family NADH-FMN oxidoreductase RutF
MPNSTETPAFDRVTFRRVLGCFATGVTIVTSLQEDGPPCGLTANSFTSVSLDPPLVLVCLDARSNSLVAIRHSGAFAVNILGESQRDLSGRFASKQPDKFGDGAWSRAVTGAPTLDGALAWLDCRVEQSFTVGDHEIVIGRVVALGENAGSPLGYFRGGYFQVSLSQDVTSLGGRAVFGAIVQHRGRVLLRRHLSAGTWGFPEAAALGSQRRLGGLLESLADAGAPTALNFLYSVAEIPDGGSTWILYRGELTAEEPQLKDPESWRFFAEGEIPWDQLRSYETRMTLRRFFKERAEDRFGLFADTGSEGFIAPIGEGLRPYTRAEADRTLR